MIFNSVSRRKGVAVASSFVGCTATESGENKGGGKEEGKKKEEEEDGPTGRADKTAAVNIAVGYVGGWKLPWLISFQARLF